MNMKGDFQTRGDAYMKKDAAAQKRHGVTRTTQLVFPDRTQKVPMLGRLALAILKRYNARIVDALSDNEGDNK